MPSVAEIPWLRPARTLQAIEGGAAAGARRAQMETSAGESAARIAAQSADEAAQQANAAQMQSQRLQFEQQRTQQEMAQAKVEADARAQVQNQQHIKAQEQIKIDNARKDAELGLRQTRIQQFQQVAQSAAAKAAMEFAARDKFSKLVQSGVSPEKAIFQTPELMATGGVMSEAIRANVPKNLPTDYETITDRATIDASEGSPAMPAIPAHREGGIFGFGGKDIPAKEATPEIPATPKRVVTKTRKVAAGKPESKGGDGPSQSDIEFLKSNPGKASAFNRRFGKGTAEQILSQQEDASPEE